MSENRSKKSKTKSDDGTALIDPDVLSLFEKELVRRKRVERFTLGGAMAFVVTVVLLVIFYQGQAVASGATKVMRYVGIGGGDGTVTNVVTQCKDPRNARTPYCEDRKAFEESTWKSITRYGDKPNSFSLHNN